MKVLTNRERPHIKVSAELLAYFNVCILYCFKPITNKIQKFVIEVLVAGEKKSTLKDRQYDNLLYSD
jgi:hypothetical protein